MGWQGLQQGKKKALKRVHWRTYTAHLTFPQWVSKDQDLYRYQCNLVRARNTTKRCSSAIHGCGHRRDLEGETIQERRLKLIMNDEY